MFYQIEHFQNVLFKLFVEIFRVLVVVGQPDQVDALEPDPCHEVSENVLGVADRLGEQRMLDGVAVGQRNPVLGVTWNAGHSLDGTLVVVPEGFRNWHGP